MKGTSAGGQHFSFRQEETQPLNLVTGAQSVNMLISNVHVTSLFKLGNKVNVQFEE